MSDPIAAGRSAAYSIILSYSPIIAILFFSVAPPIPSSFTRFQTSDRKRRSTGCKIRRFASRAAVDGIQNRPGILCSSQTARHTLSISSLVVKTDGEKRTVPVSSVPKRRWALGAQ